MQDEEGVGSRLGSRPVSPKRLLEREKRIRREIANSNERRRMHSINAGFESLKALLPDHEGEKLSKAAILQGTADYVHQLEQEITRLSKQNSLMSRRMLNSPLCNSDGDDSCPDSPLLKRNTRDSVDERMSISSSFTNENGSDDSKREKTVLRRQLEHERALRMLLEEQIRNLESRLFKMDCGSDAADSYSTALKPMRQ